MASLAAGRALDGRAPSPARPADSWDGGVHEGTHPFPLARRRGGRLKPPVYDPGHKSRFAVRINTMPRGQIIAQRQETHLPAIADDAMEQTPDPLKRGRTMRTRDHEDHAYCRSHTAQP
jgi:hypothetical protein